MRNMFAMAGCIALMTCLVPAASAAQSAVLQQVEGFATAINGDTLEVAGEVFFLAGMVVPVNADTSRDHLTQLLSGQNLVCKVQETTQGSHPTANCLAGKVSVSEGMVRAGVAFAYRENNLDFSEVQSLAQKERLGLWAYEESSDQALAVWNGSQPPRDCLIKGNKGREKPYALKYHSPGAAYYSRTRVNIHKGESWFCSTADAKAAGFIASGK